MSRKRHNILGVLVDAIASQEAVDEIISAERERRAFAVSALAVHGVMTGFLDAEQRYRLNSLDLALPDGQPVRWALNILYGARLSATVRGTDLTLRLLSAAADSEVPVFFYGSRPQTLDRIENELSKRFPRLVIAGCEPSQFRSIPLHEVQAIANRILSSGARLVFVGLGCPRQEAFVYELRNHLPIPLIAVGAAFDYVAGTLPEPPLAVRRRGFEWAWRLVHEPRRLWRRYLLLNPAYAVALTLQAARVWRPSVGGRRPVNMELDA